jgi:hypothetical protein
MTDGRERQLETDATCCFDGQRLVISDACAGQDSGCRSRGRNALSCCPRDGVRRSFRNSPRHRVLGAEDGERSGGSLVRVIEDARLAAKLCASLTVDDGWQ